MKKIQAVAFVLMVLCGGLWCVAEYHDGNVAVSKLERRTDLEDIADNMLKKMLEEK
jgi:hypothetical protein